MGRPIPPPCTDDLSQPRWFNDSSRLDRSLGLREAICEFLPDTQPFGPTFQVLHVQLFPLAKHDGDHILKISRASGFELEKYEVLRSNHPYGPFINLFASPPMKGFLIRLIARREKIHWKRPPPVTHTPPSKHGVPICPLRIQYKSAAAEFLVQI